MYQASGEPRPAFTFLQEASGASLPNSVQGSRAGSLQLATMGVFIPQKLANATSSPSPPQHTPARITEMPSNATSGNYLRKYFS